MLAHLRDWILSLAGVTVFGSMCDVLLPEGSFGKYIRLAVGLIMALTMLMPIQNFVSNSANIASIFAENTKTPEISSNTEKTDKEKIIKIYKENLSNELQRDIVRTVPAKEVKVTVRICEDDENFGQIKTIDIIVSDEITKEEKNKIKKDISGKYSVESDDIRIK